MSIVWDASPQPPAQELPPGPFDLVVVGGGLAGLSVAYHALGRRPGLRVAVLEKARVGAGASGRNTGMVGPGVAQSLTALVRRVGPDAARALYAASLDAVRATRALVQRERIACDLEATGQLLVARTRADRRRLRDDVALRARLSLPHEALDDRGLRARIRLEAAGADADGPAALHLPTAFLVDPAKLVAGLARCVRARGGRVCEDARVRRLCGDGPVRVEVEHGRETVSLVAQRVVVAAGSETPSLGVLRGRVLPLRLQVLATAPVPREALEFLGWRGREAVIGASRLFDYFRLTADGRLVYGGGAPRYGSDTPSFDRLERLIRERFAGVPGMAQLPVTHAWTGEIDYVLDGLPAIGPLRGRPGVLLAVGWCGHGLALSIAAGEWIADRLEGVVATEPLPWFRDRPPLVPLEPVRRLACRAAIGTMALCDRVERGIGGRRATLL